MTVERKVAQKNLRLQNNMQDEQVDEYRPNTLYNEKMLLKPNRQPMSILSWHVTMQFDAYYSVIYFIVMFAIQLYKKFGLKYPPHIWEMEISTLVMFAFITAARLYQGMLANRAESWLMTLFFQIASVGTLLMVIFFAAW